MFEQPNQDEPAKRPQDPAQRAREKADEFRIHAQLAAVFEGTRKWDAHLIPGLDPELARDIQRAIGRLEKAKLPDIPVLAPESAADAASLLNLAQEKELSSNDYHIYRRPGEVMIVRWLEGDQVDAFYERLQAHFDAALAGHKDDERDAHGWQQDPKAQAYLAALDAVNVKMADWYLRDAIRKHNLYVLSTQSADELNIAFLCDYIMEVPPSDLVGPASAPPEEPTEQDLAWFFKLFTLRGIRQGVEQMCFFVYMQKSREDEW